MYVSSEINKVKNPRINVSKPKFFTLPFFLLVLLYVAVLLFIGFSEFVSAGFSWSTVGSPEWWSKTITAIAINNIILLGTIMYKLQKDIEESPKVVTERNRVEGAALMYLDPVTLDPWLVDFNLKRKINKYKRAMAIKLDNLNKKVKPKDLEAWVKFQRELDFYNLELKKPEDPDMPPLVPPKPKNKYVVKRITIETQMSDEFIQDRILYMGINYKPIKKSFITNGYVGKANSDDQYDVENGTYKMFRDLAPKIIITVGYLAFINTLVFDLVEQPNYIVALVAIALKLVPILMQIYNAISYVNSYIRDKVMVDLRTRWDIIVKYAAEVRKVTLKKIEAKEVVPNG